MENLSLDTLKTKFDSYIELARKNLVYVGAGFAVLALLGGGFAWHRHSVNQKEQAATTILADCLSQYEQAAQGRSQWQDVVTMAHAGYEKFSGTQVAPYILGVEVDALLAQDKKQEALEKIDTMLAQMGSGSSLYPLYALKSVLIKLDMPEMQEAAAKDLQKLAQTKNDFTDAAQYYLGLYYQNAGQQDKALEVWKPLVALNEGVADQMARSPWATLAQSKINGLA